MQKRILALSVSLAAAGLPAQSFLYSPNHIDKTEGNTSAYHPGFYAAARYQLLDGDHRGSVAAMNGIAFRYDYRSYRAGFAEGRSWSEVTVQMGDGDAASFGTNMGSNFVSAPFQVYKGKMSWPQKLGVPASRPAKWGGDNGDLELPFQAVWVYSGQKDILSDWTFTGGTLANGGSWSGSRGSVYYIDSDVYRLVNLYRSTYRAVPAGRLNNNSAGVTTRCNDTTFGSLVTGAYLAATGEVYSPYYNRVEWRNKLVLSSGSFYTAPGAPVIHAWSVAGNIPGVDIGTGCNRLHTGQIFAMQSFLVPPLSVNRTGFSGYSPAMVFPYTANMAGFKILVQGAWADSRTSRLSLTQATEMTLPSANFNTKPSVRRCAYTVAGLGPYVQTSQLFNPCLRYRK